MTSGQNIETTEQHHQTCSECLIPARMIGFFKRFKHRPAANLKISAKQRISRINAVMRSATIPTKKHRHNYVFYFCSMHRNCKCNGNREAVQGTIIIVWSRCCSSLWLCEEDQRWDTSGRVDLRKDHWGGCWQNGNRGRRLHWEIWRWGSSVADDIRGGAAFNPNT